MSSPNPGRGAGMPGATPGPWRACKCGCGLIWDASGEVHVASAISGRDIGQPWHACDIAISDGMHGANSRLIAASPALLAALQGMVALWDAGVRSGDLPPIEPRDVAVARQTIAIATAVPSASRDEGGRSC